ITENLSLNHDDKHNDSPDVMTQLYVYIFLFMLRPPPISSLFPYTTLFRSGHVFAVSTPGQRSIAARQIIDELRHQYLIAFESSGNPGWHPLVVRARQKDLVVRARSGYMAGQSRPSES